MAHKTHKENFSFHSAQIEECLEHLDSHQEGLSKTQAQSRLEYWGENQLPMTPPTPVWKRFLRQFHNIFIYLLFVSALVSLLMGHWVDAGVILAVVLVNATIGFYQEGKAEAALRAIAALSRNQCLVQRDGITHTLDASQLVPGDLVLLEAGDRVPADLRLLESRDLQCDESLLTGESHAVSKVTAPIAEETSLAERCNLAFMGSLVTFGTGKGLVIHTGKRTQIGQINQLVQKVELPETPLQERLRKLAVQLSLIILAITAATLAVGLGVHNQSWPDMLQSAIGIAVAAIPEELPAIVTICLALGVERMARRHALARRLPAVEVLGSVDVICSDKTGTLTANAMTARSLVTTQGHYRISGEGYAPKGDILDHQNQPLKTGNNSLVDAACRVALLCNNANITLEDGDWLLHGDPTEGALLVMALKQGFTLDEAKRNWPRRDLLPFETEKRYMASLHSGPEGQLELAIKGAPDRLLELCEYQMGINGLEPLDRNYWQQQLDQLASQGMRVLALACKPFEQLPTPLGHDHMSDGLVMLALTGISDPPRPEAIAAIAECQQAGIRVVMITGDNPVTAAAISAELGLKAQPVVTGAELDKLDDTGRQKLVQEVDIFARTSPTNKLQLVEALQALGLTPAMTGDGVNDAPALRRADIGVAMGRKGTEAAKEAADFVLTDDNFATIARAVAEGRRIYDNIIKSIGFVLPTNLAQGLIIILAVLFGWMQPITTVQILWVNMVTAVTLAMALAFERRETRIMKRPPRPRQEGIIGGALLYRILLVGAMGAGIVFGLFNWQLNQGASAELARSMAVNALVMLQVFYLLTIRRLEDNLWQARYWKGAKPSLLSILLVMLLQLMFTYLPLSQQIFAVAPLNLNQWGVVVVLTLPILIPLELEKRLRRSGQ